MDTLSPVAIDPELAGRIRAVSARRREAEDAVRRVVVEHERLIVEALDGSPLREVAEMCGLSHTAVLKIKRRSHP